jgi:hypothetical protein
LHHLLDPSRLSAEHWPIERILGTSSSLVGLTFFFFTRVLVATLIRSDLPAGYSPPFCARSSLVTVHLGIGHHLLPSVILR